MRKRQFSQPLHLCLVLGLFACLGFTTTGCGGGNTSGGVTPPPPPQLSVTISANPQSITDGQSTTLTITTTNSTSSTACTGADGLSGSVSDSGTIKETPAQTTKYTVNCTDPKNGNATDSVTVTVNAPAQLSVTISANPSTIVAGGSTDVNWSVANSTSSTACTGADGLSGSEPLSGSATETPSATTKYTVSCTDPTAGNATDSVTVTVNPPPAPTITSISPQSAAIEDTAIMTLTINGTGITSGTYLDLGCLYPVTASYTSTQVSVDVQFNNSGAYSPGFCPIKLCTDSTEKSCSKTAVFAFAGSGNQMAVSSSGEIFFLDQTSKGNVRKYASDGTVETPLPIGGFAHCIASDDKTQILVLDGLTMNADGTPTYIAPQGFPSGTITGCAARNGYHAFIQPSDNNAVSWYDLTGGSGSTPTVHTVYLPDHPGAVDIGVFGGSTYIYVATITGTPKLYEIDVSSGAIVGGAPALAGLTPLTAAQLGDNPPPAGWYQVHAFDNGPATGTIVVFSAPDKLLSFADQSTMKVTASTTLSGTPMRVAADTANARVLIANIVPGSAATTTSEVDVATPSVETSLTATFTDFPVGFAVDSTGQTMYVGQRSDLQSAPIK